MWNLSAHPLNKKKKEKKHNKKATKATTWNDDSSADEDREIDEIANMLFMAINDDEVNKFNPKHS